MSELEKEKWCYSGCAQKRVCTVCGNVTEWACSDCLMDLECTIYVCNKTACRDAHEEKCPHILSERSAALERVAVALREALTNSLKANECCRETLLKMGGDRMATLNAVIGQSRMALSQAATLEKRQ